MSEYLRPEYTPLFTQVQDFIADQLNTDPQLSALGIEFLPEHRLDIEYEIKNNLGKQGTVGIVNTLKGTYGGHNGSTNAWEIEAEVDVLENPPVRRAQMKKMGLSAGSTADILDWVQESLCAPSSPTYGKFCAMSQELGEDRGIIVGRSIMKTFAIADVSAVVSGEHHWICPYALQSDLSALSAKVDDLSVDVHGDYIQDADGNKIEADLNARRVIKRHAWYVTDTRTGGYSYSLQPIDSFLSAEFLPDDPSEGEHGFKIELNQTGGNNYAGLLTDFLYYQGEWVENEGFDVELLNGALSATCDQYLIEYALTAPTIINTTLATLDDLPTKTSDLTNDSGFITSSALPTKTSDLTNDSGFITSAEIEPYHEITAPTVNTGIAKQAMSIALHDNLTNLKPNSSLGAKVKTNTDLTDEFTAVMGYSTYYPYNLEKYFEQTFSPALALKFCEGRIGYLVGSRPRIIYTGYMFRTGGAGFAMPCSEDGTPDGRLYETTNVTNTAVIIADQTTSLHQLTFTSRYSDPYGQVATIDGQASQMTCWRMNALKMYSVSEELANKSDLPTKTSDLTNDSGFITSADIITKRALSDFNVYVDPMANMTTTKFTVVVSYAADPTYPLFTVELTHTGGDAATWSWSPSGSNQSISIDYSSLTGKYNLHYYNLQDGGGNEHSGGMNLPLTSPYWTGEAQDDWFHFSVTSQTTTIATKEYVDGIVGNINTILDNINGEVI